LTVIGVWQGWELVKLLVFSKTETSEIIEAIEMQRSKFNIPRWQVVVDQDGVGGGVVKGGRYVGFSGGTTAAISRDIKMREAYENLKAQCAYRFFEENCNTGDFSVRLTAETVIVNGNRGTKIKLGSELHDIRDLIVKDLLSYRRKDSNQYRHALEPKETQKQILSRSPDFGDMILMRKYFDVMPVRGVIKKVH
jgi:hypothetical protein